MRPAAKLNAEIADLVDLDGCAVLSRLKRNLGEFQGFIFGHFLHFHQNIFFDFLIDQIRDFLDLDIGHFLGIIKIKSQPFSRNIAALLINFGPPACIAFGEANAGRQNLAQSGQQQMSGRMVFDGFCAIVGQSPFEFLFRPCPRNFLM